MGSDGPEQAIVFRCEGDDLLGVLHRSHGQRRNLGILIVVGGPQYRVGSHRQFVLMARRWAAAGYPVLRFDYRGMGDSEGDARSFDAVDSDIRTAMNELLTRVPELRGSVIFGLCDAASAALMYCKSDPRVKGLILANPWVRTPEGEARSYVRHYYASRLLQRAFWRKVVSGDFRPVESVRGFLTSWLLARRSSVQPSAGDSRTFIDRMSDATARYPGQMLFLISQNDLTAQEFRDLCEESVVWRHAYSRPNVSQYLLEGADHTFSTERALEDALHASEEWLDALERRFDGANSA